ncbi:thioredoxin domain-containing protein [Sinorhizobium meliloti]|uniref:hypothetical protein n=1 Tax=Rhizobium meliloti TaxID=382 RepID=UPI0013E349C7|nr:hypothetical protein [Sinorhizobium meliloti]
MKPYYAPGFSSMAGHIAMLEANLQFDLVKVDIWTKEIEGGGSYTDLIPKATSRP